MDIQQLIVYIGIPAVASLLAFVIKGIVSRIDDLEVRMREATSEKQVRQLINDRYDPLAEDIREIKQKLDKMFDMMLDNDRDKK